MKDDDTQHETIVSQEVRAGVLGPVLAIDLDLALVKDEDLLALLLLEEERKAEASDNIQNIRAELFTRVEHGKPLDMYEHPDLGGDMGCTVTVMKKRIKPRKTFNEAQIISNLPKAFRRALITTTKVDSLKRDLFLELVVNDPVLNIACGHLVRDTPESFRLEVQKVSAFLEQRRRDK